MDPCNFIDTCIVPGRRRRQAPVPIICTELNYTDAQREFCDNDEACMCDLKATGDETLAADSLQSSRNFSMLVTELSKFGY